MQAQIISPHRSHRRAWHGQTNRRHGQTSRRYGQCRANALKGNKLVWLKTNDQLTLTTALEAGITTILFDSADSASRMASLAAFRQLVLPAQLPSATQQHPAPAPDAPVPVTDFKTGSQVAQVYSLRGPSDLHSLMALVASWPPSSVQTLVVDATDWKVIPAENLVALAQACPSLTLMATATSCADALTMLGALEVGTHGVVLVTDSPAEVRHLVNTLEQNQQYQVTLQRATVTQVTPLDMGDRVCVDLTCVMRPGEGMLVGSFARGLFLVHSECADTQYIASRPFRVNAGAVHSYLLAPGGRTAYLSELRSGAAVTVVDAGGATRQARVGRCKIEARPMVLVEAETGDGVCHNVVLQNAETVKLVRWRQGQSSSDVQHTDSGSRTAGHDSDVNSSSGSGSTGWQAISVSVLQPGDEVLVHCPAATARHTGIAIDEWLMER